MRWLGGSVAPHPFHPHRIPLAPGAPHPPPEHHHHLDCPLPQPCPHRLLSAAQTSIKRAFLSRQRFLDLSVPLRESPGAPWAPAGGAPTLGEGAGTSAVGGGGGGGGRDGGGLSGPPLATAPPPRGLPHLPPTSVRPASSCRSRAFTTSASSRPLLRSGMATPTQAPTKGERRPGRGRAGEGGGGSGISELRREDLGRFRYRKGRGMGKGVSVPSQGGGPCSAPLGAPPGLLDTPSRWCRFCAGPAVGERQSREKGCADR